MTPQKQTNRMLIKLSGEALSDGNNKYSEEVLSDVAKKIKAPKLGRFERVNCTASYAPLADVCVLYAMDDSPCESPNFPRPCNRH